MKTAQEVRQIKRRHAAPLLALPGVCGVGVERDDNGEYVIAIHLESDDPAITTNLPARIEDCPVKLVHSGPFRKVTP
jgi:hypothetical protein